MYPGCVDVTGNTCLTGCVFASQAHIMGDRLFSTKHLACCIWLLHSNFAFGLAVGGSNSLLLGGNRSEGWYSVRIASDMNFSGETAFGSTYTSQGAVACTRAHVLGATFPSMLLPVAPQSGTPMIFSMAAVIRGGAQQLASEQSNGVIASLQGLKISLSSSQGSSSSLSLCVGWLLPCKRVCACRIM